MPFCIRCEPASCGAFENIISINLSINANFKEIDTRDCNPSFTGGGPNPPLATNPSTPATGTISSGSSTGSSSTSKKVINGPLIGNISVTAYAFGIGQDPWNGARCEGSASASQGVIQKQDYFSDSAYLIPNDSANAKISGDIGSIASINEIYVSTEERRIQSLNGISIGTRLGVDLGASFSYTGLPIAVEMPNKNNFFNVLDFNCCFLTGFSYTVNFPSQPAQATYSFQFVRNAAKNNGGRGAGGTGGTGGIIVTDPDSISSVSIFNPSPTIGF